MMCSNCFVFLFLVHCLCCFGIYLITKIKMAVNHVIHMLMTMFSLGAGCVIVTYLFSYIISPT